jgi:hypothetical protein
VTALQPEPPAAPGQEGILDLDHQIKINLVAAGTS